MVLYGASGFAKKVVDVLEANGIVIDYVVDDNPSLSDFLGYEVRRDSGVYEQAIIAIGSNDARKKISERITVNQYAVVQHPSAIVSRRASLDEGTIVMQGAIIESCAKIGKHCIVNSGSSIAHDCKVADFVHVSPHATLLGNVEVGEGSWIGAGSVVKQGIKIGANCIVGAGAVVVKDVPDGVVVVGVPAKILQK